MLSYYTTKKEKAGFGIQDYSIKVTPLPNFYDLGRKFKGSRIFFEMSYKIQDVLVNLITGLIARLPCKQEFMSSLK